MCQYVKIITVSEASVRVCCLKGSPSSIINVRFWCLNAIRVPARHDKPLIAAIGVMYIAWEALEGPKIGSMCRNYHCFSEASVRVSLLQGRPSSIINTRFWCLNTISSTRETWQALNFDNEHRVHCSGGPRKPEIGSMYQNYHCF